MQHKEGVIETTAILLLLVVMTDCSIDCWITHKTSPDLMKVESCNSECCSIFEGRVYNWTVVRVTYGILRDCADKLPGKPRCIPGDIRKIDDSSIIENRFGVYCVCCTNECNFSGHIRDYIHNSKTLTPLASPARLVSFIILSSLSYSCYIL